MRAADVQGGGATGDAPRRRARERPEEEIGHPVPRGAAREHLANERTLLAWIRTAVTLTALGFAVARFGVFLNEENSRPTGVGAATLIGVALIAVGIGTVAVASVRCVRAGDQIRRGRFRAEYWPEALLAVLTAALGLGVLTYLLVRG